MLPPDLAAAHTLFMAALSPRPLSHFLAQLRALCHADIPASQQLFQKLLPSAWRAVSSKVHDQLAPLLAAILTRSSVRPNLGFAPPPSMLPTQLPAPPTSSPPAPHALSSASGSAASGSSYPGSGAAPAYSVMAPAWGWAAFGLGRGSGLDGSPTAGAAGSAKLPPSVVRTLLACMAELRPLPVLSPYLLAALSSAHGAWHAALQVFGVCVCI